ncbi:hypothetical protein Tco_0898337 [Tanacetum coccineum]
MDTKHATNINHSPAKEDCYEMTSDGIANMGSPKTFYSFASVLQDKPSKKIIYLTELRNYEIVKGDAIAIHINNVEEFAKKKGMEHVIESGPWLIRLVPLILNVWTPNVKLRKDRITTAPVWVKLHHVPIVAYSKIGLSLITTNMYARALIEVSLEKELLQFLVVAILFLNGKGHSLETIKVEYEWEPPCCTECKIFDHVDNQCRKKQKVEEPDQVKDDGFIEVNRNCGKAKNNNKNRQVEGIKLTKPKLNLTYRPINRSTNEKGESSSKQNRVGSEGNNMLNKDSNLNPSYPKQIDQMNTNSSTHVTLKNSFSSLMKDNENGLENEDECSSLKDPTVTINDSDSEEIEELILEELVVKIKDKSDIKKGAKSHIASSRLDFLCSNVFRSWNWYSNSYVCTKGLRIILGWNPKVVDLVVISQDAQVIHSWIWFKADQKEVFYSFIHAHNHYTHRCSLWSNLGLHKHYVRNRPWSLLRDLNAALYLDEKSIGSSNIDISMREFKECVEDTEVSDVNYKGLKYTWNQKPKGDDGILIKIDKIMANLDFNDVFVQLDLDKDPFNQVLREEEVVYVKDFNDVLMLKEQFLKQKAKIEWLRVSDSNSAYFYKVVKGHTNRSRIDPVVNMDGNYLMGDQVPMDFVAHYSSFLGQQGINQALNSDNLFTTKLDSYVASYMLCAVSTQEVKEAIFSMGDDKSLGPNGYTTAFFKEAWDIVSTDVTKAVKEFFINGMFLKEVNHTIIAFIPKVSSPTRINDYRPISCYNVIYKYVSKIISNQIKDSLRSLVSPNQSAFIPERRITDNILLTQEIMHNYHLDRGPPRCAFKVDIQKAYDIVDWHFIWEILFGFGFHPRKRGLRQGDPLSPYLFTLTMEVFTLMLHRRANESDLFTYHRHCAKLNLIKLYFADDLFLFAHGDVNSAQVIMAYLDEFKGVSGLVPSLLKSTTYFFNVLNHTKLAILNILPFKEGRLPIKYLGVPLITSRLVYRDCKELIEKVRERIHDWKNKSLSATGDMRSGKAKVSWDVVCLSKKEGGLGIRKLDVFNKALMIAHLKDSILEGQWNWPHDWFVKYPVLSTLTVPTMVSDLMDTLEWRHRGLAFPCTISNVWDSIRPCADEVDWYAVVWNHMKVYAGLPHVSSALDSIVDVLMPISKRRSARASLTEFYLYYLMANYGSYVLKDCVSLSLVVYGSHLESQLRVVLFFPSPRFFPLGFSWEGVLRRQDQLDLFSPNAQLVGHGVACHPWHCGSSSFLLDVTPPNWVAAEYGSGACYFSDQ